MTCCKLSKARASGAERERGKKRIFLGGEEHTGKEGEREKEIERKGRRETEARAACRV